VHPANGFLNRTNLLLVPRRLLIIKVVLNVVGDITPPIMFMARRLTDMLKPKKITKIRKVKFNRYRIKRWQGKLLHMSKWSSDEEK